MSIGKKRNKIFFGLGAARGNVHRYTWIRWAVGIVFTIGVALLPLMDVLRFDFWGGRHMYLGEELDLVTVAKRFAFPFLAVNILIIVVSRFLGRYLCGFVCPYGSLARLAEWVHFRDAKNPAQRYVRRALLLATCFLLAAVTFSFWVDWRVFLAGSPTAIAISAGLLLGVTATLFLGIYRIGLRFCRDWCPSGVYFALLGHETGNGISFDPENCTDCKACDSICPMDLVPRAMTGEMREGIGFYPENTSNFGLCIRCGDCVIACEDTNRRASAETPLKLGWLPQAEAEEAG